MEKKYYIVINKSKVYVSKKLYKEYWKIQNRYRYIKRLDQQNNLLYFESYDKPNDSYIDNIADYRVDIEEHFQHQYMIECVLNALKLLDHDEFILIFNFYFLDKTLEEISSIYGCSISTIKRRRDKILNKLQVMLKDL